MRTLWSLALAVALIGLAVPARAQQATPERPGMEDMRRRIRERVAERIQQELNLTPDQMQQIAVAIIKEHKAVRSQIERFAKEVVPRVRG